MEAPESAEIYTLIVVSTVFARSFFKSRLFPYLPLRLVWGCLGGDSQIFPVTLSQRSLKTGSDIANFIWTQKTLDSRVFPVSAEPGMRSKSSLIDKPGPGFIFILGSPLLMEGGF